MVAKSNRSNSSTRDEWCTIKVRRDVYDALIQLQGLIQYKTKRRVSLSDIIAFALQHLPPLTIELPGGPVTLEPEQKEGEKNGDRVEEA